MYRRQCAPTPQRVPQMPDLYRVSCPPYFISRLSSRSLSVAVCLPCVCVCVSDPPGTASL